MLFISILIIAGISWVLVEIAIKVSALLNIPEAIIALTVIAIGTSVPYLFSSVIVAKQGRGDMAVSNAIGSNIFDILIGLGVPFLIVIAARGIYIDASGDNLLSSSIILFVSIIPLFIILLINKWKVVKITGFILLGFYLFYIIGEIVLL